MNFEHKAPRRNRISRRTGGQSAVEFAMVIPGVLLLALAITNFAMVINAYNFVCSGARDGTRYAAVRGATSPNPASSSDIRTFVLSEAAGLDPSQLTVATTWTPDNQPNSTVAVQVQYNFQFQIPFVTLSPVSLTSNSQLVISQ
jgi:Flp pilus assembly protein TadG